MSEAYLKLTEAFSRRLALHEVRERLGRDMDSVVQKGGIGDHDRQSALLAVMEQELLSDKNLPQWLAEAEAQQQLLPHPARVNLALMRRTWVHQASLPDDLVEALSRSHSEGCRLHTAERTGGNWEKVLPFFANALDLMRQAAQRKQQQLGLPTPYDALLDQFSPGWTSRDYDRLFDELEPFVKDLLPQVTAYQQRLPSPRPLQGPFDTAGTATLCRNVLQAMGFDAQRGYIYIDDRHPTVSGSRNDTRLSARLDANNPLGVLFDTIHEGGHALYIQNTPADLQQEPAGQCLGMDIHESQSLIWEFVVGKSKEFSRFIAAAAQETLGDNSGLTAENIYLLGTHVKPNLIRISSETSELTYLMHIMLRYRLEKDMINGTLEARDLPAAWNAKSKEMFGIEPSSPAEGCMQDIHWFANLWGYFPSYAVGFMAATQMYQAALRDHPGLPADIAQGRFGFLKDWLVEKVHACGSLLPATDLVRGVTGAKLGTDALKEHLKSRYLEVPAPSIQIKPLKRNAFTKSS